MYTAEEIRSADPTKCWVDNVKNVSEQHHIRPVEYNGPEDGLTVPLCPTCHTNIHREAALQFTKGTIGKYINAENYPNIQAKNRAFFLVDYIVKSRQDFEDTGDKKAEGARNMAQVSFTREELAMAHDLKKMMGMRSLERMLKYLVLENWKEYKKRGK